MSESLARATWRLIALLTLGAPVAAFPHRVNVYAHLEGNRVEIEAYFGSGAPVRKGKVEVRGTDGTLVYAGITDEEGHASFVPSRIDDLEVVVSLIDGHRAKYVLKKGEFSGGKESPPETASDSSRVSPRELRVPEKGGRDAHQSMFPQWARALLGLGILALLTGLAMKLYPANGRGRSPGDRP